MAVAVWTRSSGMGPSTRVARPKTRESDADEAEDAVAAEFCLEDHQDDSGEQKHDGGVTDGEQIEAEEAEQNEERAEGAGNDGSGDVELEVDEEATEDEEEDGDVGVGELAEEALAEGGWSGDDFGVVEVQGCRCCRRSDGCRGRRGWRGGRRRRVRRGR